MKQRCCALLAATLSLLLAGCQAKELAETASVPPGTAASMEKPMLTGEPELSRDPLEELLAQQPIDDGHDAFLVDTKGRLGTLLVTAEKGEQGPERWEFESTLSIWNPQNMDAPIQTMAILVDDIAFGHHEVVDANFDGHMDFGVKRFQGNQPTYWYFWIWDEEAGQFVEEPAFREISCPRFNPETEVIDGFARYSGGGDGLTSFYRWENGELVCVRRIETGYDMENRIYDEYETSVFPSWIKVEDRVDGELTQVYYQYFAPDAEADDFFPEQAKWTNLDYHGEE